MLKNRVASLAAAVAVAGSLVTLSLLYGDAIVNNDDADLRNSRLVSTPLVPAAGKTAPTEGARPSTLPAKLDPCNKDIVPRETLARLFRAATITSSASSWNASDQKPPSNLTSCSYMNPERNAPGMATVSLMTTRSLSDVSGEKSTWVYSSQRSVAVPVAGTLRAYLIVNSDSTPKDPALIKAVERITLAVSNTKGKDQVWVDVKFLSPLQPSGSQSVAFAKQVAASVVKQLK